MFYPTKDAQFATGSQASPATITEVNYNGFVATQDTIVTHIAYGWGDENGYPSLAALTPNISVKAGVKVPLKFSSIRIEGTIIPYY